MISNVPPDVGIRYELARVTAPVSEQGFRGLQGIVDVAAGQRNDHTRGLGPKGRLICSEERHHGLVLKGAEPNHSRSCGVAGRLTDCYQAKGGVASEEGRVNLVSSNIALVDHDHRRSTLSLQLRERRWLEFISGWGVDT